MTDHDRQVRLLATADGFANAGMTREAFEAYCAAGEYRFTDEDIVVIGDRLDYGNGVDLLNDRSDEWT